MLASVDLDLPAGARLNWKRTFQCLRSIVTLISPQARPKIILTIAVGATSAIALALQPYLVGAAVAGLADEQSPLLYVGSLIIVGLAGAFSETFSGYLLLRARTVLGNDLSMRLVQVLLTQPVHSNSFLTGAKVITLMTRAKSAVNAVVCDIAVILIPAIFGFIASVCLALSKFDASMILALIGIAALNLYIVIATLRREHSHYQQVVSSDNEAVENVGRTADLSGLISGFRAEQQFKERQLYLQEVLSSKLKGFAKHLLIKGSALDAVRWGGFAIVLLLSMQQKSQVDPATLVTVLLVVNQSLAPIEGLVQTAQRALLAIADYMPCASVLDVKLHSRKSGARTLNRIDTLEVSGFSAFLGTQRISADVCFSASRGQLLLIQGRVGSGKSTLAQAIVGNLTLAEGGIRYNGVDISEYKHADVAEASVYVSPTPFIFSGSIEDNVKLYRHDISRTEVADVLSLVSKLSAEHPDFWHPSKMLNDGGTGLSTGQKYLIAIARVICKQPSLVILDESISHFDHDTSIRVLELLRSALPNSIIILISHDDKDYDRFDQHIILQPAEAHV